MDTSNNIGIWISEQEDVEKIPNILQKLGEVPDLFIISSLEIVNDKYMVVSPFHIMFHDCTIIFLSVHDLIENKDLLKTQNIVLCVNNDSDAEFLTPKLKENIRIVYL